MRVKIPHIFDRVPFFHITILFNKIFFIYEFKPQMLGIIFQIELLLVELLLKKNCVYWKHKFFSSEGKEVLIKAVVPAI